MPAANVVHPIAQIRLVERPSLDAEVANFLIDREARGLSPRTVAWYGEQLRPFCAFCQRAGVADTLELAPDVLRRYLLELSQTHNPGGVHGRYRAVSAFLRWYEAEYEPTGWKNPIRKVQPPRTPEQPLEPVNLQDLAKMLATCERRTFIGDRDRAMLLFLLDSGCRRAEVRALNLTDVNLQSGAVLVRQGKGGKARTVFMGAKTRRAVVAYLRHRPHAGDFEPLWCSDEYDRLTFTALRAIVHRRAERAGVNAPSLHSFRRGFAIAALRAGVDLVSLQRLLGHSSLAVVSRYLKQVEGDLAAAHAKAGPVDHLLG